MPVYEYKAFDKRGKSVSGIVDADSGQEARLKLREKDYFITEISETSETSARAAREIRLFSRVRPMEVSLLVRQIATLLNAGIPLLEALTAVIEQQENRGLQKILSQVREAVREGRSLADALAPHGRVFSPLMVNMIRSGESSGSLEIVLLRLADFLEQQVQTRQKIQAALVYPAVTVVIALIILVILLVKVVPAVTAVFEDMQQALPLPTAVLIAVSDFVRTAWWLMAAALAAVALGLRSYLRTDEGRLAWDRWRLRIPVFGPLHRKIAVSRFARTLGTLLKNGVPLLSSLEIVENVVGNRVLEAALQEARGQIGEGASIHEPLRRSGVFPPVLIHMIHVGEKSGTLEDMLGKVADTLDNEIDTAVNTLTAALEPAMILGLALFVGFIVFSILLPIFEMSQMIR